MDIADNAAEAHRQPQDLPKVTEGERSVTTCAEKKQENMKVCRISQAILLGGHSGDFSNPKDHNTA